MKPFSSALGLSGIHLIEASAGTGKTYTIVGLYLRALIQKQLEVSNLLVVTFTKAATAELKSRVRERLTEVLAWLEASLGGGALLPSEDSFLAEMKPWLEETHMDLSDLVLRIRLALTSFDQAAILTLHGFCQRALSDRPFASGMPFLFEVEQENDALIEELVEDHWRRRFTRGEGKALMTALLTQGLTPQRLQKLLKIHARQPLAVVHWPLAKATSSEDNVAVAWAALKAAWAKDEAKIRETLTTLVERKAFHLTHYTPDSIKISLNAWGRRLRTEQHWAPIKETDRLNLLSASRLKPTAPNRAWATPLMPKTSFFDHVETFLKARDMQWEDSAYALRFFLKEALEDLLPKLRRLKRERTTLTYDDLLTEMYLALHPGGSSQTSLAFQSELRRRYPVALVDEFQDTDPVQLAILEAIYGSEETCLFMVGDPKQAIYSFRQADLPTYLKARSWARQHWTLSDNQRSTEDLIEACNLLFTHQAESLKTVGLNYVPVRRGSKPLPQFKGLGSAFEVWTLPQAGQLLTRDEAIARVADSVATEVVRLLTAGQANTVSIDGRGLEPQDIAILVRSHREGRTMRLALARRGVRAVERSNRSVLRSEEAEEWRLVLAALAEPKVTGLVLAALATALMQGTASRLDTLTQSPLALEMMLAKFQACHDQWLSRGFSEAVQGFLMEFAVFEQALSGFAGERRLTNLRHIFELLMSASASHPTPDALRRHYERLIEDTSRDELKEERLESDEGLVKIFTVHAAKGLEFPVVFCPTLWSGLQDRAPTMEAQPYFKTYHDTNNRVCLDYRWDQGVEELAKRERQAVKEAEHFRLIYVALTRAVAKVILVAGAYVSGKGATLALAQKSPLQALVGGAHGTDFVEPWQDLMARAGSPKILEVRPLPAADAQGFTPLRANASAYAALVLDRPIPPRRPLESYSSLLRRQRGTRIDQSLWQDLGRDHDEGSSETREAPSAGLPRGAALGNFLHGVLEAIDFKDRSGWGDVIEAQRVRWGFPPSLGIQGLRPEDAQRRVLMLLERVLNTPLAGQVPLSKFAATAIHREQAFWVPTGRWSAERLSEFLHQSGLMHDPLENDGLRGHLRGYIDLVYCHEGRWFVADWKSNDLGPVLSAYTADRLQAEIEHHRYGLQAALYVLFLHRLLKQRLPAYRPELHLGGAQYLFLRGMPGPEAGDCPTGVWRWCPGGQDIERLDAILSGEGGA